MVMSVTQKAETLILPFSTLSENRTEQFTKEIERAAIFCLTDLEKARGRGLVMKQPPEKLAFIAEVYYPFWLATLDNINIIFDGLDTISHTLTYLTIPETQIFIDNGERSCKTRQAYTIFLSDNINYFQTPSNEERHTIDGLITNPEFLQEFTSYLHQARHIEASLPDRVMVSPTLDESSLTSILEELQSLKSRTIGEVNALYTSMKLISVKTENFTKATRNEIKKTEEKLNKEMEKCKASIKEQVDNIRKEYDEEVTEYSKKAEEELLSLQQDAIKLEKTKDQLMKKVEHCDTEAKTCAISKDSVSEHKWRDEKTKFKDQLSETEAYLKELNKRIKEVKDEKKIRIFELKTKRDVEIKEATKDLVEIESSRDAKVRIYEEEMEKLEELTLGVIEQIDKLAKLREKSVYEFNKLGVSQKRRKCALIYVPFYLACYQRGSGKRYIHFPPSIVNSVNISVRFKGAFGKAKIRQLLHPLSKKLVSLLNKFPLLMEQNAVFNRDMTQACAKANILRTKNSRESIEIGLEKLEEEGWLSEKEHKSFSQILSEISFSTT